MSRRVTRPGRRTRKRRALESEHAYWADYRRVLALCGLKLTSDKRAQKAAP